MNDHSGLATYDMGDNAQSVNMMQNTSMAVQIAVAELNQGVVTARQYPRNPARAMNNILSLATLDAQTAEECIYALPRGGKPIRGPSVRLAEIIASQWGNCLVAARIVHVDRMEKVVVAEGVFHDLETGMKRVFQTQRRISEKSGRLMNDDMIAVTGNAAMSIAMREAVLKSVPKAIWRKAYEAVDAILTGGVETLTVKREKAITAFAAFGVTPEQIFACLEVASVEEVTVDDIATLRSILKTIKLGEGAVEDYFKPIPKAGDKPAMTPTGQKLSEIAARRPAAKTAPNKEASKDAEIDLIDTAQPGAGETVQMDRGNREAGAAAKAAEEAARHKMMDEAEAAAKAEAKAAEDAAIAEAEAKAKAAAMAEVEAHAKAEAEAHAKAEAKAAEDAARQKPAAGAARSPAEIAYSMAIRDIEAGGERSDIFDVYGDELAAMQASRPDLYADIMAKLN